MDKEVSYKRELNHSYMVLRCTDPDMAERYDYRIMVHNRIGSLLPCSLRQLDGEAFLYYDISSRQPLERLYEGGKLGAREVGRIVRGIASAQEELGEYMLDESGLLLEEGMIFADVETRELFFAFYPGGTGESCQYAGLADFLLEHVDHGQEHAVNLAYRFYKLSKTDYFVLSSFLPFLEKELAEDREHHRDGGAAWEETSWEPEGERAGTAVGAEPAFILPEKGSVTEPSPAQPAGSGENWTEPADKPEKGGLLSRFLALFGRREKKKSETAPAAVWPDMVWDSYEQQLNGSVSQDTVYFADLEKRSGEGGGLYCLREQGGGRCILLKELPLTVGKLKGRVSVLLTDGSVSRIHARIEAGETGLCVRDLNSRNGTAVNGRRLAPNEAQRLTEGDELSFGRERFRYERMTGA
ncbi:MAG: DUF6382 domain-containing protein [Eubacteriales bacterium]|nr:DUF6382 domain-containing protein [Eubacteriales bacterium]